MSELAHADIFFFITTIVVVLLGMLLAVVLVFIVIIAKDVRAITARMRRASESLEQDFNALRYEVAKEGVKARALVDIVLGFISRKLSTATRAKKPAKEKL